MLADWHTAPIEPKLHATLGFLEKLTLTPGAVSPTDLGPLRASGLSDEAIEDAIHVCALFNIYDRVADALGFAIPGPRDFARGARNLIQRGYR